MSEPMTGRACCDQVVRTTSLAEKNEDDIKALRIDLEAFMAEMRKAMLYRLPLWVTATLTGMGTIIGWLLAVSQHL